MRRFKIEQRAAVSAEVHHEQTFPDRGADTGG